MIDIVREKLNGVGLRVTPQRIAILQMLCRSLEHPTAARLYEQIREDYPNIALGTVYYTLERFVESGIAISIGAVGDDQVHYDGDTASHSHLACISCQKILDIESPGIDKVSNEIHNITGFEVVGSCFVYYGLCPDCQILN